MGWTRQTISVLQGRAHLERRGLFGSGLHLLQATGGDHHKLAARSMDLAGLNAIRSAEQAVQKTGVQQVPLEIRYRAFEIPPVFVVGYGLDYIERYRNLPFVGTLRPEVYRDAVT